MNCVGGLETISLGEDGSVFDFAGDRDKKNLISIKQRWERYGDETPRIKVNPSLYN